MWGRGYRQWLEEWREETARREEARLAETARLEAARRAETARREEEWRAETARLAEADRKRHEDWLVEWRAQAKEQKLRFDAIDAAMENDKRVTREIVLEMQEARERDREFYADLRDEMRAQRDGLLRILDEMRRGDGPSPASA